ncbi:MAG: FHA domain-containing protein [Proteobacteria bacterium]|nr:FHA domain-containing protein [Pseudomonadota bacterium]
MPLDFSVRHPPQIQVSWFNSNHILQKQAVFSGYFSVRRSLDNDFVIASPTISRRHFEVKWENDNWWIEDLQSSNGTYVNQNLIKQRCLLALPAIVALGNFEILLKIETAQSTPERIGHTTDRLAPSPQPISQKNPSQKTFSKDELKA